MSAIPYYQRAPRYVLRPGDRSFLRFAGMDTKGIATHARVRDLSSTGLSFFLESDSVPLENETLKIEFGVPDQGQIAWLAQVVRVETRSDWTPHEGDRSFTLVALEFRELPPPYRKAIEQSLGERVNEDEVFVGDRPKPQALAGLALFAVLSAVGAYWMSSPLAVWTHYLGH